MEETTDAEKDDVSISGSNRLTPLQVTKLALLKHDHINYSKTMLIFLGWDNKKINQAINFYRENWPSFAWLETKDDSPEVREAIRTLGGDDTETRRYASAMVGDKYKQTQSKKAKKTRSAQNDDGTSLDSLIFKLVEKHIDHSAKELWPILFSRMDEEGFDPVEHSNSDDLLKHYYEFTNKTGTAKTIKFSTFQNKITKARKQFNKKSF